jgi:hypothetical protein
MTTDATLTYQSYLQFDRILDAQAPVAPASRGGRRAARSAGVRSAWRLAAGFSERDCEQPTRGLHRRWNCGACMPQRARVGV